MTAQTGYITADQASREYRTSFQFHSGSGWGQIGGMKFTALLLSLVATGCFTHGGPYVTNISSDGRGGINIEKCMARYDPWMSTVTNDQCTSSSIRLSEMSAP